ncbi:MAG TPA: choice-of-anchor Q domain-containing protein [Solirubrobacteraceae bacterium]|nr:choice-of-anchor Q domain-containing protein [Solirubrobacteraceae bacterium]
MVFPQLAAAAPATLYVAGGGGFDSGASADTGSCQIESTPCKTLAYAVSQASSGDTIDISGILQPIASTTVSENLTLAGNPDGTGATIDGGDSSGDGLLTIDGSSVTLRNLTLQNGFNTGSGGGAITIDDTGNLTIIDSALSGNAAFQNGGAIDNGDTLDPGSVTIIDSTLSGNYAGDDGGAIDNSDSGNNDGSITITDSTLSGNSAGINGGAIDNNDHGSQNGVVTVSDSTLDSNSANYDGGAIDSNDGGVNGSLTIADSTLLADSAGSNGNEIDNNDNGGAGGAVYVAADLLDGSCVETSAGAGSWTDAGYNAAGDASCLGGSSVPSDATGSAVDDLAALDSYGGPTQTVLLEQGNPALGLIPHGSSITTGPASSVTVACPATDQRGITSAAGQACDAGSVQQTAPTAFTSGTGGDNAGAASDGNDCADASTPCATVQGALWQIVPGGTVELSGSFSQSQAANIVTSVTLETNAADSAAATIDGNAQDTTGLIDILGTGATVTVDGLTLENGYNTALPNGYGGGAITHNVGGQLTVSDSTLADNTGENGGAIDNNDATSGASLTITDSTLTGNSAPDGGAIDNSDNNASGGPVNIANSTFYDNSSADGGAVDNDDNGGAGGELTITQSTLVGDTAFQLGPEIGNSHYGSGGSVWVGADVFGGTCTDDSGGSGTWLDAGYNAATDASCLGSSPAATDAAVASDAGDLGSFANNGGGTETLALALDNPAIGLMPDGTSITTGPGSSTAVSCPVSADQRGVASVSGAACDAGAVQDIEQALTFGSGLTSSAVVGQSGTTVTASSTSGLVPAFSVDATTTHGACSLSGASVTFAHAGSCVIDASQSGNQNVTPATASRTITVGATGTSTALSYSARSLAARVSAVAPGGGAPSGTVEFLTGSQILGTATLGDGSAKLAYTAPTNSSEQITASYVGTSDYTASGSTALTVDGPTVSAAKPSITAKLSSNRPRSRSGWWTAPVKVSFTCHGNGATIRSCPRWFTITTSGKGIQADGMVTTTSGQTAKVAVRGINIDLTKPRVSIGGQNPRRTYPLRAPAAHCRATEAVSGIGSCKLTEHSASVTGGYVIHYTAHATSNAGSSSTRRATVRVSDIALIGARSRGNATYAVAPAHSYVLEVLSKTRPIYLNAAPSPLSPARPHEYFSTAESIDGTPLWRVTIRITPGFKRFPAWTIGVRTGGSTNLLRLLT